MNSYIVTIIASATHTLHLQTIMAANSEAHVLAILNEQYPQFRIYETGPNPQYRCYITFRHANP